MNCRQQQAALFVRNCLRRNYKKILRINQTPSGAGLNEHKCCKKRAGIGVYVMKKRKAPVGAC